MHTKKRFFIHLNWCVPVAAHACLLWLPFAHMNILTGSTLIMLLKSEFLISLKRYPTCIIYIVYVKFNIMHDRQSIVATKPMPNVYLIISPTEDCFVFYSVESLYFRFGDHDWHISFNSIYSIADLSAFSIKIETFLRWSIRRPLPLCRPTIPLYVFLILFFAFRLQWKRNEK